MSDHATEPCPKCWGDGYIDHDLGRERCPACEFCVREAQAVCQDPRCHLSASQGVTS